MGDGAYLTPNEFAQATGIPGRTVRLWCKLGRILTWTSPGGRHRIPRSEIERVLTGAPLPTASAA
jgi:excisionase family DNA binding protein